ncbi:MAG: hypothetical protein KME07_08190 [Pegethrix bostrychoides GSE-TBD4-15B]|jgi:hypothetical protein|uniref:Uncharacterized protein n=1 Tax=Pegethrix bostrychoides GSE-TBD4-15B TaxID=2839662 RepID=A0A951U496_9CYAN|nr:hypothetical protein [Pegethrix bostrychoides GSE-TBD4-15B]
MAFIRLNELLTANTQYIVKVKWKVNSEDGELSASVFLTGTEKSEVVSVKGEVAYKLWDLLHVNEEIPRGTAPDSKEAASPSLARRVRKEW